MAGQNIERKGKRETGGILRVREFQYYVFNNKIRFQSCIQLYCYI